ncbi:hypothetical protein Aple_073740 [Acrocarpospora pleiomorpha]|uniref:HTH gntR-type domain-containing protein n=1 Tax=Acrocarpospora pleiomorpha TaxID=90975 RepID=A0A5M3XTB8_9ACTN|nr:ATP-binding protein [Acrocarpospora pleiomorpha]GES24475.1 hypothetical protein Aple_073740 [Acrocarpospora pleiomorpha]
MTKNEVIEQLPATAASSVRFLGSIKLPGNTGAASSARKFIHNLVAGWANDRLDDALLLTTELVSNAILHSDSGRDPDGRITVEVFNVDGFIQVQVIDQGSARSVPYVVADPEQRCSGFGLRLVEEIASEWGHAYVLEGSRAVWFDLAPPPESDLGMGVKRMTWTELMRQRSGQMHPNAKAEDSHLASPFRRTGPRRSKQAAHREQIVGRLAAQITSGELAEGTPIPTTATLMDAYGISLRSALLIQHALREQGLVRLIAGHGYVAGAPGPPPEPVRPPVPEQVVHVAAALVRKIRRGDIAPHARVATIPELMREHGLSKQTACDVLCVLRCRGYAYETMHKGTRATTFDQWPPKDTSLEGSCPPDQDVPDQDVRVPPHRKPRLALVPKDSDV